jgi:hypothetical protein
VQRTRHFHDHFRRIFPPRRPAKTLAARDDVRYSRLMQGAALMRSPLIAAAMALALLPSITAAQDAQAAPSSAAAPQDAQGPWLADPHVQSQLAAGKVVSHNELDGGRSSAQIDAAIRIDAPPQTVWKLLTECKFASIYIPGLKHCRVINHAADGSWAVVEHDIRYSALLPMVHSVFRADYRDQQQIAFHRVSGDFKSEAGVWLLRAGADDSVTLEYHVAIQPGFWVPRSMVQHSLKRQLPAALIALRSRAEQMAAAASGNAAAAAPASPTPAAPPASSTD